MRPMPAGNNKVYGRRLLDGSGTTTTTVVGELPCVACMVWQGSAPTCVPRASWPPHSYVPATPTQLGQTPMPVPDPPPAPLSRPVAPTLVCPPPAGSGDQINGAQVNSVISNQQQINSNSKLNANTLLAGQGNLAGIAINRGELHSQIMLI